MNVFSRSNLNIEIRADGIHVVYHDYIPNPKYRPGTYQYLDHHIILKESLSSRDRIRILAFVMVVINAYPKGRQKSIEKQILNNSNVINTMYDAPVSHIIKSIREAIQEEKDSDIATAKHELIMAFNEAHKYFSHKQIQEILELATIKTIIDV